MKLDVTRRSGLMLGLVLVASVSVYLANSTAREKARGDVLADKPGGTEEVGLAQPHVDIGREPGAQRGSSAPAAGAKSSSAKRAFDLVRDSGVPRFEGDRLPAVRTAMNPHTDRGRVARLSRSSLAAWRGFAAGDRISLPAFDGEDFAAQIALRTEDVGWLRLGGELEGVEGTFALNTNFDEISGFILFPKLEFAYEITTEPSGEIVMIERPLEALMCTKYRESPASEAELAGTSATGVTIAQGAAIPTINTRPGAKGVIYVDFDGAQVTDPAWNGGRLISAAPSSFTAEQVDVIIRSVAEDFAPFDLTITTNLADYAAAPVGRRMWVIVTPTSTAAPGSGGVAYLNSWSGAGRNFSSTVPCWVFNLGVKSATDTIAHEVGHTFGLNHDGATGGSAYYAGHGGDMSVPTSWGPIMGAPFSKNVTQWSKGEYAGANNTEDDLYVISRDLNGIGYRPDSVIGTTMSDAIRSLPIINGTFNVGGLIRRSDAGDLHQFSTTGGTVSATIRPVANIFANIDAQLELKDGTGATLAFSNPLETLGASLSRSVPAGTYWLVVRSASTGARPASGYTSGYSAYGSVGEYQLSGAVSNTVSTPLLPSLTKASGIVGQPFNYALSLAAGVQVSEAPAPLPPGILFDAARMTFSGTPTEAGEWNIKLAVATANAKAEGVLNVRIELPSVSLTVGLDENRTMFTTALAPWTGTMAKRFDGIQGPVAVSGIVADKMSSSVRFFAKGPALMTFWWMVSSEAGKDTLKCLINGKPATDAVSGQPLVISGESGWIPVQVNLPEGNKQSIEFQYSKDAALRAGSDRGWVYGVQIRRNPPAFRAHPQSVNIAKGGTELKLSATVIGATKYEWKLNGVTLFDQVSPSRTVSGSRTAELTIKGLQVADCGAYTLEATSAVGSTVSREALVQLPGLPVFTQQPVEPIGLKAGDVLRLTAQVSGPGPVSYTWYKNGQLLKRTTVPTLELKTKGVQASGLYKVIATNPYGSQTSTEVRVSIAAP